MVITTTVRRCTPTSNGLTGGQDDSVRRTGTSPSRANGLLRAGRVADGFAEDAGRDPRYLSPYTGDVMTGVASNRTMRQHGRT